jgi:hypothetical protein
MTYPCRFDRLPDPPPPPAGEERAREESRRAMTQLVIPERFWMYKRYDDPRLPSIRAYNRGVALWNSMNAIEQRHVDSFCPSLQAMTTTQGGS